MGRHRRSTARAVRGGIIAMNRDQAWELLGTVSQAWVEDESSDVVFAGEHEGRWAVRMAQQARDFTTVWFDVGNLTVGYEAYVSPNPPHGHLEVYRQLLRRNERLWRVHFAIDKHEDVFLVGRVALAELAPPVLDEVLGAIYEAVELSFRSLIEAGFAKRL